MCRYKHRHKHIYIYISRLTPPLDPPWACLHMRPVGEVNQIITHFTSHIAFPDIIYINPLLTKDLMQIGEKLRNQRDP